MKMYAVLLLAVLILCTGAGVYAQGAEVLEGTIREADLLSGAWRTEEDGEGFTTLLLYPEDAFRLYRYVEDDCLTYMLEGVRAVEDDALIVTDIRLGTLYEDGTYNQTGKEDRERFIFSLELEGNPTLTITNEKRETITLYPFDMDSPG